MKFLWTILLLCLSVSSAICQKTSYELDSTHRSIEEAFNILEKEYGLLFSYKTSDINQLYTKAPLRSTRLPDFLSQLLNNTQLSFEITDSNYVLIKSKTILPTSHLYGQIIDSETQSPLAYANIIVKGTNMGTSTDTLGQFSLQHAFDHDDQLIISYIGYETKVVTYKLFIGQDYTRLGLDIPEHLTPFLVIKDYITDGINLDDNGRSTNINLTKTGVLPGQAEPNVLRTAQFLPGISAPSSKASDLFIRGGTPDQNLILWEDIPIYHSAHYFGMISAFDPYTVEEMKVYRGGFGAEYGGRVSGVIAMESGDEKSANNKVGIGINMTHAYLYGHQSIGPSSNKTAINFSIRRSYSEIGDTPTMDKINRVNQQGFIVGNKEVKTLPDNIRIDNDINFFDSHLKISSQLTASDHIEISGLYADNNFSDNILDNNINIGQQDSMTLHNIGLSVDYSHKWSSHWTSGLKLISTAYDYNYEYILNDYDRQLSLADGLKNNKIQDNQLLMTTQYKGNKNQLIELGYHLIKYDIDFIVKENNRGARDINESGQSKSNLHSIYATYDHPISNKVGINIGLRTSYQDISNQYFVEPRIHLAYALSPIINLSASYGKYHQFVGQVSQFRGSDSGLSLPLWALAENRSIPIQQSYLYQVGAILNKDNWLIDLQLYTKTITGLSSRAFDIAKLLDINTSIVGSNRIKGADLLLKKRINNLKAWLSYSYSISQLRFRELKQGYFASDFDQRHSLQASLQWTSKQVSIGLGYKLSSGLPYTPAINFKPDNNMPMPGAPTEYNINYGSPNQGRLPSLQEINLSAQYQYKAKGQKWQSYLCLSITNLLNTSNIFNRTYYVDESPTSMPKLEVLDKINLLRTPNVSIRVEW